LDIVVWQQRFVSVSFYSPSPTGLYWRIPRDS